MTRRLLNLLTALSLLVCVVVGVAWVSSSRIGRPDGWRWGSVTAADGGASVRLRVWSLTVGDGVAEFTRIAMHTTPGMAGSLPEGDGFGRTSWMIYGNTGLGVQNLPGGSFTLRLPAWSVVAAAAPLPLARTLRHRRTLLRQNRLRAGLCPKCGYDLRASAERCPECGTMAPPQPAT